MSSSCVRCVLFLICITRDVHTGLHHFGIIPQYLKVTSSQLEIPIFLHNHMDVEVTSQLRSKKHRRWAPMHDGHTRRSRRWRHLACRIFAAISHVSGYGYTGEISVVTLWFPENDGELNTRSHRGLAEAICDRHVFIFLKLFESVWWCISSRLKPIDPTTSTQVKRWHPIQNCALSYTPPLIFESQHSVDGFLPAPWHPDLISFGGIKLGCASHTG